MYKREENPVLNLTFDFALKIVDYCTRFEPAYLDLRRQLFKAGTSIGANVWESQNAESRKDFIHKLKIAAKEGDESAFWLSLCEESPHLPSPAGLSNELTSIQKLLSKIISSSKRNQTQ